MLALRNGILLDGKKDMVPVSGKVILIEDKKIVAIQDEPFDGKGCEIIDLNGRYVLPGLINLHVHLPANGFPKKKESDPKKLVGLLYRLSLLQKIMKKVCYQNALTQLKSGVTTIRTVGGLLSMDSEIRDEINSGKTIGPAILAANMAISVPDGHMAGSLAYEAKSKEEARLYVKKIAEDKPDLIKLMITGGVLDAKVKGEPGEVKMPAEYVREACKEAHKRGMIVAAHVESPEGVRIALQNGVDTVEHGAEPDEEILSLFQERRAALVATLSPSLPFAFFDPAVSHATELSRYNGKIVFQGIVDCAKKCLEKGIPVGLGTDTGCPYITHYDMWREILYFVTFCGVTPSFALYTATKRNAEIAGIDAETGSIEVGKYADLIVCDQNPLEDITALRHLSMVFAKGEKVHNIRFRKCRKAEKELESFIRK